MTASFTPAARLLHAVGHTGRQGTRCSAASWVMAIAGPTPTTPELAAGRLDPALELRRLIAEARAKNESFELEYAHLEASARSTGV